MMIGSKRIEQCVYACEGIENPEAIEDLVEAAECVCRDCEITDCPTFCRAYGLKQAIARVKGEVE